MNQSILRSRYTDGESYYGIVSYKSSLTGEREFPSMASLNKTVFEELQREIFAKTGKFQFVNDSPDISITRSFNGRDYHKFMTNINLIPISER
jgi:hypothetical protein